VSMHRSPSSSRGGIHVLRRLSLRGRFALLAAVAVSVAVVGAALASYFLVAGQLRGQVDNELSLHANFTGSGLSEPRGGSGQYGTGQYGNGQAQTQQQPGGSLAFTGLQAFQECRTRNSIKPPNGAPDPNSLGPSNTQLFYWNGTAVTDTCDQGNSAYTAPFSDIEKAIATGTQDHVYYSTYTVSGVHVRVLSFRVGTAGSGYVESVVQSLAHVDSSLQTLEIELAIASIAGIGLATIAGLLLARSAVRPVRRLTLAVEHVAKTEDLSIKLPVEGKDEINRLGAAFNRMTKALATSRDRQRQLIADAGHELRTPLTSLRTNVDLLLRSERTGRELPPGRRETMLVSVDQQLHELSGLVTDLLELSRNQEGGTRRTMRVALHESVGRAVERAKLRGPGLYFDVEIEPWYVQGDPTAVDRAVVNLLDNAVKFSPAAGTVTVRLKAGEYTVTDQGPGIDPADLPHVFERFWRSDSARSLPGSGLGLAIVSQVAEESGGKVGLYPAPGGGTTAHLILPGEPGSEVGYPQYSPL
jgi:two-component system sensor histidine kinase MprB